MAAGNGGSHGGAEARRGARGVAEDPRPPVRLRGRRAARAARLAGAAGAVPGRHRAGAAVRLLGRRDRGRGAGPLLHRPRAAARRGSAAARRPPPARDWRPEPERPAPCWRTPTAWPPTGGFEEAIHLLLFRSIDDLRGAPAGRGAAGADQPRHRRPRGPAGRRARAPSRGWPQAVERTFFGGRPAGADDVRRGARRTTRPSPSPRAGDERRRRRRPRPSPAFSAGAILALVLVGIVAFAGLAVLSAYAPDLRSGEDGRAHALSKSAVGFAGAPILMKALGAPAVVSRTPPAARRRRRPLVILTPGRRRRRRGRCRPIPKARATLIVLPKWGARPTRSARASCARPACSADADDVRGAARRATPQTDARSRTARACRARCCTARAAPFAAGTCLPLGAIDGCRPSPARAGRRRWSTRPGRIVLADSRKTPSVWVLADPDLLNNQGLASLDTARAGMAILRRPRGAASGRALRRHPERLRARPRLWAADAGAAVAGGDPAARWRRRC